MAPVPGDSGPENGTALSFVAVVFFSMVRVPQHDTVQVMTGSDGSAYLITSENTCLAEIMYQSVMLRACMRGQEISAEAEQAIAHRAVAMEADFQAAARARGVPSNIRKLFQAKRKRDAEHHARSMVIEHIGFHDLIINCGTLRLSHHSKHHEFIPPGRELSDSDRDTLCSSEPSSDKSVAERKLRQLFEEREHRAVHLFANQDEWHCFYMTYRDIAGKPGTGTPHWFDGFHVHYISHLFGGITREHVWAALDERQYRLPSVHVRYRHPDAGKRTGRMVYADAATGRVVEVRDDGQSGAAPQKTFDFAARPIGS